jgi:hypothetical protein
MSGRYSSLGEETFYKTTAKPLEGGFANFKLMKVEFKMKPSIFMPKYYRIFLKLISINSLPKTQDVSANQMHKRKVQFNMKLKRIGWRLNMV